MSRHLLWRSSSPAGTRSMAIHHSLDIFSLDIFMRGAQLLASSTGPVVLVDWHAAIQCSIPG